MEIQLAVKAFYVAFFSEGVYSYERYSINMDLGSAEIFLESQRKQVPDREWVILAVLDI